VQRVTAEGVDLQWTSDGQTISESLPLDTLVWTAGSRPRQVGLAVSDDPRGRLSCSATLEVEGHPGIFALGDGARVPHDPELPSSAQVAMQQAQLLAANLRRSLVGEPLAPFHWNDLGEMLSLGVGEATLTGLGLTLAGPAAQTLRRLTYLTRLPGALPLLAAADWVADRGSFAARP
jgi:NADH dehydrogenase